MEQKIQALLLKAFKGDVSGFKSKVGSGSSDIPKEAIPLLAGFSSIEGDSSSIKVQGGGVDGQTYEIDPQGLNPLELASINCHPKD